MSMITVTEALSMLRMDQDLVNYLISKREEWEVFGKMNSHLYRRMLMTAMREANLNGEQSFMVFFLFSVIKNRDRVLKAMEAMSAEDKAKSWFAPVLNFINTRITQYVSDVVRSRKFPAVNVPNCNPGLDILVWCLITHPNRRTVKELSERTTFSQMFLNPEMQEYAKEGYKHYWDNVVKSTKNPDAVAQNLPVPAFREEYYANSVSDDYLFVDLALKEVLPRDRNVGYSLDEVVAYIKSIDPNGEYSVEEAALERELEEEEVVV